MPPVRVLALLNPKAFSEPKPGHWTFDLAQNMVGVVRLTATAAEGYENHASPRRNAQSGRHVFTATNLRGAPSIDTYVWLVGTGTEIWLPTFTFHGFRYVEVMGLAEKARPGTTVTGIVIGTDTPLRRRLFLLRSAAQPASVKHPVGPAGQLRQHPHRLPPARRAAGLDGRCSGFHPHGYDQRRRGRHFSPSGWLTWTTAKRPTGGLRRRQSHHDGRQRHARLGRRGRHLPLDDLPGLRRPPHPRKTPAGHDQVGRVVPRPQHRADPRPRPRRRLRRLALYRRQYAQGPHRHRVLRLLDQPSGTIVSGRWATRRTRPNTSSSSATQKPRSSSVMSSPTAES